jgi:MFS family permease
MQMGYVFSIFALAYGIFEIPAGWLGDRLGQRKMLTGVVALWSAFTVLTGLIWGYFDLLAVRFAFGAAESGAFPSLARAVGRWFRTTDRGRANGIMWMGARIGAAIAPPLATLLIRWLGWRITFSVFGMIGGIWCAVFWPWFRDNPAQHPSISASDLAYIREDPDPPSTAKPSCTPWKRIFMNANLWAFFWMYFATSYGFWFLLTWLPTYFIRQHGLSAQRAGFYAALPLAVGAVSSIAGGALSDTLVRRTGSLLWGRRMVGLGGYLLAGAGFTTAGLMQNPFAAIVCLMLAETGMDLAVPVAWTACLEVGGSFGGTTTAFMNTASCISAFISPLAAAWVFTRFKSFDAMLISAGVVYLIAALLWLKVDATCSLTASSGDSALA